MFLCEVFLITAQQDQSELPAKEGFSPTENFFKGTSLPLTCVIWSKSVPLLYLTYLSFPSNLIVFVTLHFLTPLLPGLCCSPSFLTSGEESEISSGILLQTLGICIRFYPHCKLIQDGFCTTTFGIHNMYKKFMPCIPLYLAWHISDFLLYDFKPSHLLFTLSPSFPLLCEKSLFPSLTQPISHHILTHYF